MDPHLTGLFFLIGPPDSQDFDLPGRSIIGQPPSFIFGLQPSGLIRRQAQFLDSSLISWY
jgi:hypothetical protein